MDPGNTNLLSQKYKTLQTEIKAAKEKLDTLKEAAKQADQALPDGKMSQDQYDALQREIAETEQDDCLLQLSSCHGERICRDRGKGWKECQELSAGGSGVWKDGTEAHRRVR
jgi:phage-related minor tail protein